MSDQKPDPVPEKNDSSGPADRPPRRASLTGNSDPRLKRFLRQARAIIAAERGINARSQHTLQSLADQMQLPPDLFDEALRWLQQAEGAPLTLERYEKAFAEYLDSKFSTASMMILPAEFEKKILDRARRKYQVSDVRAQQIVDHRAAVFGITRISPAEAFEYMEMVIREKIGRQVALNDTVRSNLYKAAQSWGVQDYQVDEIVLNCLAANRRSGQNRKRLLFPVAISLLVILLVASLAGYQSGWFSGNDPGTRTKTKNGTDSGVVYIDPVTGGATSIAPFDPTDAEARGWPEWWPRATRDEVHLLSLKHGWFSRVVVQIASENTESRKAGYQQLTEAIVIKDHSDGDQFDSVYCRFFFDEPDDLIAAEWASRLESLLHSDSSSSSPTNQASREPPTIPGTQAAFRANRLLARLLFWFESELDSVSDLAARKSLLSASVRLAPGLDPESMDAPAYLKQSARLLAVEQWNRLVQASWISPAKSAQVIQPMYELTAEYIERPVLEQFRARSIESTLSADISRYREMEIAIRQSVDDADDAKIQEWIRTWFSSGHPAFKTFLAPLLLEKCGLPSGPGVNYETSLAAYRDDYQNSLLGPLLTRNLMAAERAAAVFTATENDLSEISPEMIADIADATNTAFAFVTSFEDGTDDFVRFDSLTDVSPANLADFGSPLAITRQTADAESGPTASDNRKKNEMLARIRNPESSKITRMSALEQIARVIPRFPDLAYEDADLLSAYLIATFEIEESLNTEKLLSTFKHLPTLKLALANRLPESGVGIDQALTVTSLLVESSRYSASGTGEWRDELSEFLFDAAIEQLNEQVAVSPGAQQIAWNQLEPFLNVAYRRRLAILSNGNRAFGNKADELTDSMSTADLAALIVEQFARTDHVNARRTNVSVDRTDSGEVGPGREQTDSRQLDVSRSLEIAHQWAGNELARTVMINQVLITVIAENLTASYPDRKWDIRQILSGFELDCRTRNQLGQRLYLAELTILKLMDLNREETIRSRRER